MKKIININFNTEEDIEEFYIINNLSKNINELYKEYVKQCEREEIIFVNFLNYNFISNYNYKFFIIVEKLQPYKFKLRKSNNIPINTYYYSLEKFNNNTNKFEVRYILTFYLSSYSISKLLEVEKVFHKKKGYIG